eukprot:TRINITY_DN8918_c1_g1_i3.p1 TRINITY_DN8918_c1_g1~~TRINITY_DN8918_c1_g1_i3.p1  ORF type:complete len:296 (+),score=29.48 TRINITY_DN8918_c1_g1_i3:114-1001(+)
MAKQEAAPVEASVFQQLLWSRWDHYDAEERAHHVRLNRIDFCGLTMAALFYVPIVCWISPEIDVPPPTLLISGLHLFATLLALYNLHLEMFVLPQCSKETPEAFHVGKGPVGRWIWMTHQTIGLVAVHSVMSLVAPFFSRDLTCGTYAAAVTVGGLATFVTIQFFLLVYSHPDNLKSFEVWAARGIQMKLVDTLRHTPPLFLALADVCFLKHRNSLISLMPSALTAVFMNLVYASGYIVVILITYRLTKQWPYGLLKDLGFSFSSWAKFALIQCGIISVFALSLWVLIHYSPAFW